MFGPISEGMRLFRKGTTVAVVGYSDKSCRVSQKVTEYLQSRGNTIIGINPNLNNGTPITVVPSLGDLPHPVQVIQVFRNSAALPQLANEILALKWRPRLVWCQQGVVDMVFQERLEKQRIPVVMDACPYALRSYL